MKILIKITKDVLKRSMMCGVANNKQRSTNCAIAVAVRDIFPSAVIEIDSIIPDLGAEDIDLPEEARNFIHKFDMLESDHEKRLCLPEFYFKIDIPEEIIEKIGISDLESVIERSDTLELVRS